nr:helix-turn-helix transcriptional regulator [Ligilactobacillus ruminis]
MLGTVLKELRKEKRMNQAELAKIMNGISTNYRSMGNRACYPWR